MLEWKIEENEESFIECLTEYTIMPADKGDWYDNFTIWITYKGNEYGIECGGGIDVDFYVETWDDPGDYPSNAGSGPLPSCQYVTYDSVGFDKDRFEVDSIELYTHDNGNETYTKVTDPTLIEELTKIASELMEGNAYVESEFKNDDFSLID